MNEKAPIDGAATIAEVTVTHRGRLVWIEGALDRSYVLGEGDSLTIDIGPLILEGMRLQAEAAS